jgi:N-acyl-D-aspartate/D-glutamate deacylase
MSAKETDTVLIIRGGTVIDGSGSPGRRADVAVVGGKISAIGENLTGDRILDAQGCVVAPGFIDIHTHYDAQATWDPLLTPSAHCGVTTCIMGNCGVGFAPCQKELRPFLLGLMEAVEDSK